MTDAEIISDAHRLAESLGKFPEPVVKPSFILVSGLPGTGKSYFSRRLAEGLPLLILESDALRRVLFPSPAYTAEESSRLFRAVHHLIEGLLKRGISLVLDATNLSESDREYLYNIADRLDAKLIIVRVEAPSALVHERLEARAGGSKPEDHSDAGWEVYERMRPSVQKIQRRHFAVDTAGDIEPVLNKIIKEVNR